MAESAFSRRMMAQKLMTDARPDPFSDSRFFNAAPMLSPDDMMLAGPQGASSGTVTPGQVAYGAAATGSLFAPGAGIADVMGYAPDPFNQGQMLPGFGANVRQGNYLDAGLQTLGVAGDVLQAGGAFVPPLAAVGTALKAPRAARVALSPEITRAISRNTDRNAKKVAKDLRQEGLLDVNDRGQSEAFYAEFERIRELQNQRTAAKPDPVDNLERNQSVRSLKADKLKAQKPIKESPMFNAWTKPNRERVLNSTYDSDTIDAEARLATVEAIAREAKKRGLEVYYTSKGQRGRAGSRYIELPDGGKVRVSDHELPDTPQRQYTRSQGIGNFADEIIVSDWETSSVDDYLNRILKRPNPNEAAGAAMDAAQARYFETGKFEAPTAENPVSIVQPTETEPGIIAFHGSGADFDEFKLEMIGTGEGAQAYGYGLYFTDSEDIAKFYRDTISRGQSGIPQSVPDNPEDIAGNLALDINFNKGVFGDTKQLQINSADPDYDFYIQTLDDNAVEITQAGAGKTFEFRDGSIISLLRESVPVFNGKPLDSVYTSDVQNVFEAEIADIAQRAKDMGMPGTLDELTDDVTTVLSQLGQGLGSKRDMSMAVESLAPSYQGPPSRFKTIYNQFIEPKSTIEITSTVTELGSKKGKMYKVGLAPKPDELLDYDKSLRQQPQFLEALKPLYDEFGVAETSDVGTFFEVVKNTKRTDNLPSGITPQALSERLQKAGIPGIKYRAAGSRATATADEAAERNYVIFDDKAVKILEKYGIVGPVAVTAAGAAAVNRGRNDNDNGGSILPDAGIM